MKSRREEEGRLYRASWALDRALWLCNEKGISLYYLSLQHAFLV